LQPPENLMLSASLAEGSAERPQQAEAVGDFESSMSCYRPCANVRFWRKAAIPAN